MPNSPLPTVLVIDDEAIMHDFVRAALTDVATLDTALGGSAGIDRFTERRPDAVLLDLNMPDMHGLDVYRQLHKIDAKAPVIFMTGRGTTDTAIEAVALGAFDYLLKPFKLTDLKKTVQQALEVRRMMSIAPTLGDVEPAKADSDALIGRCPPMQEVYKSIGKVAPKDVTVLVLGESGTGKELVARAIYHYSGRNDGPFLAINCAAIPETLLESELFGHVQGAFTGAERTRIGKFEQCHGGTLFLDEVGDMTPLTQVKLLRVLQEQTFERVGGNQTIKSDVRIIAATNRNLEQLVASGQFREDLFYRLNVYAIRVPPLRERGDDLALLVEYFVRRFSGEHGSKVSAVAPEAMMALRRYSWPGNIRELQSILQFAILQSAGTVLTPEALPAHIRESEATPRPLVADAAFADADQFIEQRLREGAENLYDEWLQLNERRLFERVLQQTNGNLTQAAKVLGINRATLRTKLQQLGMNAAVKNPPTNP